MNTVSIDLTFQELCELYSRVSGAQYCIDEKDHKIIPRDTIYLKICNPDIYFNLLEQDFTLDNVILFIRTFESKFNTGYIQCVDPKTEKNIKMINCYYFKQSLSFNDTGRYSGGMLFFIMELIEFLKTPESYYFKDIVKLINKKQFFDKKLSNNKLLPKIAPLYAIYSLIEEDTNEDILKAFIERNIIIDIDTDNIFTIKEKAGRVINSLMRMLLIQRFLRPDSKLCLSYLEKCEENFIKHCKEYNNTLKYYLKCLNSYSYTEEFLNKVLEAAMERYEGNSNYNIFIKTIKNLIINLEV